MTVIWGLDLKEIRWGKFKSSYMWNTDYHRRRTKFLVYQLAMILCVVSESLGTAALSEYTSEQKNVERLSDGNATVLNNDFVGAFAYNIFVGVFVATIFGAAFFFDLFWPERRESQSVKLWWRICAVLTCVFALSSALVSTIILSTRHAKLVGVPNGQEELPAPLEYRTNRKGIASVCLIWPGWLACIWSTILMFQSIRYINRNGPLSEHRRAEEADSPINRVEAESMPNHPLAQAARANCSAADGGNARRSNSLNRNSLNRRSANPAMTATAGPPLSYSARRGLS